VWIETASIAVNDPETACTTSSEYNDGSTVVTNLGAKIGEVVENFTEFTNQWGGGINAGNAALRGYVWVSNVQNWISPYFGPLYTPAFYALDKNYTLSDQWNDGVPAASDPAPKVIDPKLYSFDYKTGILTFYNAPTNIDGLNLTNNTCKIWAAKGYQYTGGTVLQMSSGGGGGGVTEDQLSTIKNIGRNAWIEGATGYINYDASLGTVTHYLKVFGNSSNIEVKFRYSTIAGNPDLLDGANDPVYIWPTSTTADQRTFINRRGDNVAGVNTLAPIVLGPLTIAAPPTTSTTYSLPVALSSFFAGGTGATSPSFGGSRFTFNIPMTLTPSDTMAAPAIASYNTTLSSADITTVETISVDGFTYFTTGTVFTIPANALTIIRIINVIGVGSSASSLKYISLTSNGTGSPEVGSQTANYLWALDKPGGAGSFVTSSGQLAHTYENDAAIAFTLPSVTTTRINATLKNFRTPAANSSSTVTPFFPTDNTWSSAQTNIAHVPSAPSELSFETTNGTIVGGAVYRMHATNDALSGALLANDLDGSVPPINPAADGFINGDNAIYNPLDKKLYGYNFFAAGTGSPNLAANYIIPDRNTQIADAQSAFSNGQKTLLLGFEIDAGLIEFKVNLGTTRTLAGVKTVKVYWWLSGDTPPVQYWFTAVLDGVAAGTSTSTTCCDSFTDNGVIQVKMNGIASPEYQDYFVGDVTGTVYVAIDFDGAIPFDDIRVGEFL
jgi:hypothetical protein